MQSDAINPFVPSTYGRRLTPYTVAKRVLVGVTLFPFRLVLYVCCLTLMYLICLVATVGLRDADYARPLTPWRQKLLGVVRLLLRPCLFALGYVWISVRGKPASPSEAPIVVANHVTFVDPAFLAFKSGGCFVASTENVNFPMVGFIVKAMQSILVDRSSPDSRRAVMDEIKRRATDRAGFPSVVLFPEGTTTNGQAIVNFKPGAFSPGLPVQPVVLRYPHKHLDPAWVFGNYGIIALQLSLMLEVVNRLEVIYLPVVRPTEAERAEPTLYAARVRGLMAAALGVPMTGHSLDDVALQREAAHLRLPVDKAVVEMSRLNAVFGVRRDTIKEVMAQFARVDSRHKGELTLEEWVRAATGGDDVAAEHLRPELEAVFRLLDVHDTGTVRFREWLLCMLIMNSADNPEHRDAAVEFAWATLAGSIHKSLNRAQVLRLLQVPQGELDLSDEHANRLFRRADRDGNDRIDFVEFRDYVRRNPEILQIFRRRLISREAAPVPSEAALALQRGAREGSANSDESSPRRPSIMGRIKRQMSGGRSSGRRSSAERRAKGKGKDRAPLEVMHLV